MSNLLAGLALALGGGLQGYAQGKELQRRARMEEEEARRRDEDRKALAEERKAQGLRDDQRLVAQLAEDGVFRGQRPTGQMTIGALGASMFPTFTIDNDKRYKDLGSGLYQDFALSRPGQQIGREQAARRLRSEERLAETQQQAELARMIESGIGGDLGGRAGAMARGANPAIFAPRDPVEGSPQWRQNQQFLTDEKIRAARAEAEARGIGRPRLTATAQRELDNTTAFLAEIDRAIQAVENAPDAFSWSMGPARKILPFGQYYGREMDERGPTRYRDARRGYASSISTERLQKAGVATTASELENLRPYLTETDVVGPKQALENLQNLRRAALEKLNIKRESYGMEPMVPAATGRVNPYREN